MTCPVLTRKRKSLLLDLIIIMLAFVALIAGRNADGKPADEHATVPALEVAGEYRTLQTTPPPPEPLTRVYNLAGGDTVHGLLRANGLSPAAARQLLKQVKPTFNLARVRPGHELSLKFTPDGQRLTGLSYAISSIEKLVVDCSGADCTAERVVEDKVLAADYSGSLKQVDLTVNAGDRVCDLLSRQGLCAYQIDLALKAARKVFSLSEITPGHKLSLWITPDQPAQLGRLCYEIDDLKVLELKPQDGDFKAAQLTRAYQVKLESATGQVETSLYESGIKAGLAPEIIMNLTDIFAWDVNFFTDIQPGDSYTVLYEKYYVDGQFKRYGKVLAATFKNNAERHAAVYFEPSDGQAGYYNENGLPMKKLFLKAPLNYRRISSTFTYRRIHPVFKTARPHLGVDYAAPQGTPVVALGRGWVTFKGRSGGFGNCVKLKHPAGYVTYYGHLSRYARGLRPGQSVDQGEVIGYVGSTGVSTGPHLDFRVKHDGSFVNPLKLEAVSADRLKGRELNEFKVLTAQRFRLIPSPSLNIARASDNNKPQI